METRDGEGTVRLVSDLSRLEYAQKIAIKSEFFGFNQLFRPTHIDKDTYDKLMTLDVESYRNSLKPYMGDKAIEAAVMRLQEAQAYATELSNENKVVEDWSQDKMHDKIIGNTEREIQKTLSPSEYRIDIGFYARDFATAFRPSRSRSIDW